MLHRSYSFFFVIFDILFHRSIQHNVYADYAVKTNSHPTTSCLQVNDVNSAVRCFSVCLVKMKYFSMFSHNDPDQSCVCCEALTGSALTGSNWETYVPAPCPVGYTSHPYTHFKICLKYVAMDKRYPDAVNYCNADGGDLIRIDSQLKYDIFKASITTLNYVQVWVQGVEHGTDWKFHDGTPIPNYCPIYQSNAHSEIYLCAMSPSYDCYDRLSTDSLHFMCEIYRRFSFLN